MDPSISIPFTATCAKAGAVRGNPVSDGYQAAQAIESARDWISTARDDARLPGLIKWRHHWMRLPDPSCPDPWQQVAAFSRR